MSAVDAATLYELFERNGIQVWVDGGWGIDALLREQTREHADLDIVVEARHLAKVRRLLEERGFRDVPRDDTRPWNFVLGDDAGREVDVHAIVFDSDGNGVYGPPQNGDLYPAAGLGGKGAIAGRPVACLTAEQQLRFHTAYELGATDLHDIRALSQRFGLLPPSR
jgi:lincosamide nucleotidyltransferase A/C/D/E